MKKVLLIVLALTASLVHAQNYDFNGTMSEATLRSYLARSIVMQNHVIGSPEIDALPEMNARLIGRIGGSWGQENKILSGLFTQAKNSVDYINNLYDNAGLTRPIIQTAIFEIVSEEVNNIPIPSYVAQKFGISVRNFSYESMLFPDDKYRNKFGSLNGAERSVPDITRLETRMWFYYLATQYIDAGYEAIHFGQIDLIAENDKNLQFPDLDYLKTYLFFKEIRAYANTYAARKLVLLDADTYGLKLKANDHLLFDYHGAPGRYLETTTPNELLNCDNITRDVLVTDFENGIWNRYIYHNSLGGIHPLGWTCTENLFLIKVDNTYCPGSNWAITEGGSDWYCVYGADEITWYDAQSNCYKNEFLRYAYNQVQCIDNNGYFQMPGKRKFLPQKNVMKTVWDNYNGVNSSLSTPTNISISGSQNICEGSSRYFSTTNSGAAFYRWEFRDDNTVLSRHVTYTNVLGSVTIPIGTDNIQVRAETSCGDVSSWYVSYLNIVTTPSSLGSSYILTPTNYEGGTNNKFLASNTQSGIEYRWIFNGYSTPIPFGSPIIHDDISGLEMSKYNANFGKSKTNVACPDGSRYGAVKSYTLELFGKIYCDVGVLQPLSQTGQNNISYSCNGSGGLAFSIKLLPNPAQEHVTVKFPTGGDVKNIRVIDNYGTEFKNINTSSAAETINIADLQPGLYTIIAIEGSEIATEHLQKLP